jgi:O-antigen ligase
MPGESLGWKVAGKRLFSTMPKPVMIAFAMLFLCLSAMFMTLSRGAAVLTLFALVIGFTFFFWNRLPRRTGLIAAVAGGGLAAFLLLQFMGEGVNARFDVQGFEEGGRLATYRATLRMIADHPWFGTGQGTFAAAFPAYRSPDPTILWVWDMAHNTLLEIAADMGLPIAVLVTVAWILVFLVLIRGAVIRQRDIILPVVGLSVGTLGVLHSLMDFSLQIPGYAIVALSLIGIGLAQSFSRRRVIARP